MEIDTWIIHSERKVLVTDQPGVPVSVSKIIDPEDYAQKGATVSNIGFEREVYKGFDDWPDACKYAEEKAHQLGYAVEYDNWWGRETEDEDDWN